ncbi:helix-turn-helix domain-containing protein [Nocardia sp. NPDC051750]|uniref:helix-turn-helix domain-containing protein n=1 Tax=Nocardia sp. NPDC051750 TaxID=3364325 RepID=UPI0037B65A76
MYPIAKPHSLRRLRRERQISQGEMEKRAGISQSAIVSTERAHDPRLSTIERFVEALGGRLIVFAAFDETNYPLTFPRTPQTSATTASEQSPAWRIRAWDDPRLAERFLNDGIVAISEDDIGRAVTEFSTDKGLRRKIQQKHPGRSENALGTFVTYWRHFSRNMKVGETIVLAYRERGGALKAAIGTVTGEYEYLAHESDERLRHRRTVRWSLVIDRHQLDTDLRRTVDAPGTIGRFGATDAHIRLASLTTHP